MNVTVAPEPDTTDTREPSDLERQFPDVFGTYRLLGPTRLQNDLLDSGEAFLSKKALAAHFDCSERTVSNWMAEGMPKHRIDGRVKLRVSECTLWLRQTGHLRAGAAS